MSPPPLSNSGKELGALLTSPGGLARPDDRVAHPGRALVVRVVPRLREVVDLVGGLGLTRRVGGCRSIRVPYEARL